MASVHAQSASAPAAFRPGRMPLSYWRTLAAAAVLLVITAAALWMHRLPGRGAASSLSLLIGAALGIIMQRGRFCFFCIFRDLIEEKDSRPFYAILSALAVGSLCYAVVMSAFLPNPFAGRLPPDAHIGPVSWALVLAGLAFGLGMALSGACVSGHLYRLGEGYGRAPFALVGSVIGFGLGFFSWRAFYVSVISQAPLTWLPAHLGYGGAVAVQLAALGLLALLLMRALPPRMARPEERPSLASVWRSLFATRWPPGATGAMVGVLGALAYLRVAPLGVTSQIGSLARTWLSDAGLLTGRLNGLDSFAGCVTLVIHTISDNGLLIAGLAAASFAMALLSGRFNPTGVTVKNAVTALAGGVAMGWGAMLALGCTVGTLLSGIMAFSLSGWVFFAAVFAGVWAGLRLGIHRWAS